jgi:hypothetical protein
VVDVHNDEVAGLDSGASAEASLEIVLGSQCSTAERASRHARIESSGWLLYDRADRSTQRYEVVRNKGQTRPDSTTIMLTDVAVAAGADRRRDVHLGEPVAVTEAQIGAPVVTSP